MRRSAVRHDGFDTRIASRKRHHFVVDLVVRLSKDKPLGAVGGIITLLLLLAGIFADSLAPDGINVCHTEDALARPSAQYWFGTDNLGRDLLSRVIFGARTSMIVGLSAATLATIISAIVGVTSGFIGGNFDLLVQRGVDAVLCIPGIVLMMVALSLVGPGMLQIIVVLGISWGIGGSRMIRGPTIGIKENAYLNAAIAIGCSRSRIFIRHVLPNVMAPLIVLFSLRLPGIILTEASLSFLGFGIPPPAVSWGGMLSGSTRSFMFSAPWMAIWPGLALSIVVYGVNMFGDALRDLLDPRLRGAAGRYGLMTKKRQTMLGGRGI